jgi:hypothetical protein
VKTGLVFIIGAAATFLVGMVIAVIWLEKRSEFREKMRPLIEEDLSDFASERYSSGSLMVGQAIEKREKRLALVRMFRTGRYRAARDLFAGLMEAENRFLANEEFYSECPGKIESDMAQVRLLELRAEMTANPTFRDSRSDAEFCDALKDGVTSMDTAMADWKTAMFAPKLAEASRKQGIAAWDSVHGWIQWLGLDVRPENPFASIAEFKPLVPDEGSLGWKQNQEKSEALRHAMAIRCKDAR